AIYNNVHSFSFIIIFWLKFRDKISSKLFPNFKGHLSNLPIILQHNILQMFDYHKCKSDSLTTLKLHSFSLNGII
ncbi:hypothetical protein BLOT_010184, partial [Blomia tropicalis]